MMNIRQHKIRTFFVLLFAAIAIFGMSYIEYYEVKREQARVEVKDTILPGGHLFRIEKDGNLTHLVRACRQCKSDDEEGRKTENP